MTYEITPYTYRQAKKLGVIVFPSENPKYKIDIYEGDNGVYLFSVGSKNYKDYQIYVKERGIEYAKERRRLYRIRHKKDMSVKGSRGYYASKLLW